MRYVPPWGITDPNAPYINGDPTIGQQGSIPPAQAIEHPMREIVALIEKSRFAPSESNLLQLAEGVRSQALNYAEDTGTAPNNLIVSYDPPITAYTRGLTLRVKVRLTNDGPCRISAGGGNVPIRKMNGADVGPGELPAGAIATLIYEGTAFQLSNFGGGGGGQGDVFEVNVPYTVDLSAAPGTIIADFSPPITSIQAGDLMAVKVANTTAGPTTMVINGMAPIELLPNGGGQLLQGDIATNDVVQFFYDGINLRFPPNPEMNAPVTYTVGPGQHFPTVDDAMNVLKRKTVGAKGYVTLLLSIGIVQGPINISHPSGDRLCIRGTMLGPPPVTGDFARTGNSAQARSQDAIYNINMLRTRYGTEVRIPPSGNGLSNTGPGLVTFADLLVTGDQLPFTGPGWQQNGFAVGPGLGAVTYNVAIWGSQVGFFSSGGLNASKCFACWNSHCGFHGAGSGLWMQQCGMFGNGSAGVVATFGSLWAQACTAQMNASYGFWIDTSSGCASWWNTSLGNGLDLLSNVGSSIVWITTAGGGYGSASPLPDTVGNYNSIIANVHITQPPNWPPA